MKRLRPLLLLFALAAAALANLTGCTSERESSIPWSRPATWEGQIPGMSQQR